MKHSLHSNVALLLLILILIISISKISALATQKGQEKVELNEISISEGSDHLLKLENSESMNQLMGAEDCNKGDEECFQRRIVSEAHLDYIYTQHHKP